MKIEIDTKTIDGHVRKGKNRLVIIRQELNEAVHKAVVYMRYLMVKESTTRTVSGGMRTSWLSQVSVFQKVIIGRVASVGPSAVSSLVYEDGAKGHSPPVTWGRAKRRKGQRGRTKREPRQEPALASWIRMAPVKRGIVWRDFNVNNKRDLLRLAFVISRNMKLKGRPKPGSDSKIFSKALQRGQDNIRKILLLARDTMLTRMRRK